MRTPGRLAVALTLALGVVLGLAPTAASADTSDFTFDSFDAAYELGREPDGTATLRVVETIVARFPDVDQNRGIIRSIPDDYDGVPLSTEIVGVTDARGEAVPFEQSAEAGFVELALGTDAFVRGVQTYVIEYTQQNVVRSFDDTAADEFYWDVNGTGWGQPFGRVSATVSVDESVVPALTGNAACYVGAFGDETQCPIEQAGGVFTASAADLAPGDTLTVAIGFEPGTFLTPEPPKPGPTPMWLHVLSGLIGVASLGALAAAIVSRVRAGRGAQSRRAIVAQYSEPEGLDIVQSSHLVHRASSGLPAAIVRLAVRRQLRILAYAVDDGDDAPYTLQYLTDDRADALDRSVLDAVFGTTRQPGALAPYGKYDAELATRLTAISTAASASLLAQGFQRTPRGRVFGVLMLVAQWGLFALGLGLGGITEELFVVPSPLLVASLIIAFVSGAIALGLAIRSRQLTEKGRDAKDYLEGMRLYLTVAEEERLRMLQSPGGAERVDVGDELQLVKLYEKLLPWAVVWGVEKEWMRELELHVAQTGSTPDWFVGRNGFEIALFSSAVRGMSTTMTAPSSSTGGSTGGGFSGGGGGGGGGGGR